jgi:hypothetical protein
MCLAVVAAAASAHALVTPGAPAAAVTADAHRLAVVVLFMCAACAPLAILAPRLGARVPMVPRLAVRRFAPAVAIAVAIAAIGSGPRVSRAP